MLSLKPLLLLTAFAYQDAAPEVELSTLRDEAHAGELVGLTAEEAVVKTTDGEQKLPLERVKEIAFKRADGAKPPAGSTDPAEVVLSDGTRFGADDVKVSGRSVVADSQRLGRLALSSQQVASMRLAKSDEKVAEAWKALLDRNAKKDLLVVRKGDVLDHLDGFVGDVDDKNVSFLLDGQNLTIGRDRVFGVIYADRKPLRAKPVCEARLDGGDLLKLKSLQWDGKSFTAALLAGPPVTLPAGSVRILDYSLGKIRYLSEMEPRDAKYTPFFDEDFKYRRDENFDGEPLRLAGTTYKRGLCIHSRMLLRYRVGGEFSRFQAVMGIDQSRAQDGVGDVHVVISGDGKPLFEGDVRAGDEPKPLDLKLTGVRDLEILVDFGGDLGIGDHLDLANARVIK